MNAPDFEAIKAMRHLIIVIVMTPFILAGFVVATAFIGACAGWEVAATFWDRMSD